MCCFRGTKPGNPASNRTLPRNKKANQRVTTAGYKMKTVSTTVTGMRRRAEAVRRCKENSPFVVSPRLSAITTSSIGKI